MKAKKSADAQIEVHQESIEKIRRVKQSFPDMEISYLDDMRTRVYMSASVLPKATSMHFFHDLIRKAIVCRPYLQIKRKSKPSIRVYAQHSVVIPDLYKVTEILNLLGKNLSIADLPGTCKNLFGEVYDEETAKIASAVLNTVSMPEETNL